MDLSAFNLQGKVALITGGAHGIGFSIAEGMAKCGAVICFNCSSEASLEKGMAAYKAAGIDAHGYVADVSDEDAVNAMVAKIKAEVGPVDILVNNAGITRDGLLMKMSEGKEGATGFIEDYTYDLTPGQELELASHMLEVPPAFAATKPEIDVIPLGIGGKEDPARLIFDGVTGDGIQVTMVDMGDHFRIICADIELVKQPKPMPKLPVARIMYRHKPNFQIGTAAWCYAGGAHHSVVSTALTRDDIAMFARLTGTELITIGEDTTEADLQKFFMK